MAENLTTAQVRNLALTHLGVLASGETPLAADAELAELAIDTVHAQLDGLGLLNWPPCSVPVAVALPVARLAARELVDSFGLSDTQMARVEAGAERALAEIRRHTTLSNAGHVRATYY